MADQIEIPLHQDRLSKANNDAFKRAQKKNQLLKSDMGACFGTPEGRRVLTHLRNLSGFGQSNVGGNPQVGMDIKDGTFYNAARESVYLELRKLVPVEILKAVEFNQQEIEEIL